MNTVQLRPDGASLTRVETQQILEALGYQSEIVSREISVAPNGSITVQRNNRTEQLGTLATRAELTRLLEILGQPSTQTPTSSNDESPHSNETLTQLSVRVAAALTALAEVLKNTQGKDPDSPSIGLYARDAVVNLPVLIQEEIRKTGASLRNNSRAFTDLEIMTAGEGFAQLADYHQLAVLKLLSQWPEASTHLLQLVQAEGFVTADPKTIDSTLRAFGRWGSESGEVARQTIVLLAGSSGFWRLSGPDQRECLSWLVNLALPAAEPLAALLKSSGLGHSTNLLNARAGGTLHCLVRDAAFQQRPVDQQEKMLQDIVNGPPDERGFVSSLIDRFSSQYSISAPQLIEVCNGFSGSSEIPALHYRITVEGRSYDVFVAMNQDPSCGHYHTVEEVASCLASLPPLLRDELSPIHLHPGLNPDDAEDGKNLSSVLNRSAMICHNPGLSIFPTPDEVTLPQMVNTLAHEGGHTLWEANFDGSGFPDIYDADKDSVVAELWNVAMAIDGCAPSRYAATRRNAASIFDISDQEDLAETIAIYLHVAGQPVEKEVRANLPERFRILDAVLGDATACRFGTAT